ncbi:MAG TPA: hypothetical protein DCR17_07225, partial [Verrucomicrobiales bacterium]|nr:hypothetical protein [Verrucomicrobiales bacterium]
MVMYWFTMSRKPLLTHTLTIICTLAVHFHVLGDNHSSQPEDASDILNWAQRLNTAFIQVADKVSPSVVVIEVAHPVDERNALMDLQHEPFLDQLPEEERRKFEKYFNEQKKQKEEQVP